MNEPPPPPGWRWRRALPTPLPGAALLRRWRSAVGCVTARSAPAAPAMVVLTLFAAVGVAVLDDYGVSYDEFRQREMAVVAADYVFGDGALPTGGHDRYYGVSFEAPLLLAERLAGLTDSRDVVLLRHLLTHLFFLTGGLFLLAAGAPAVRRPPAGPVRPAAVPAPSPAVRPLVLQQQGRSVPGDVHDRAVAGGARVPAGHGGGVRAVRRRRGRAGRPARDGAGAVRSGAGSAGAGPAAGAGRGRSPPRAGHRSRLRAGRRRRALRRRPLALEQPVRHRRRVGNAGPASVYRNLPLSGRGGALAVHSAPLRARLDGGHHAAGRPPAEPRRRRGRGPAGRLPPARRAAHTPGCASNGCCSPA